MSLNRVDIIKQSFSNLKKQIAENPAENFKFTSQLDALEESIELLIEENKRLETCWSKMTNKLIELKLRLGKTSTDLIYTLNALISTYGLKIQVKKSDLVHYNNWIIVKHADFSEWSKYFQENPATGCSLENSCSTTVLGRKLKIKNFYSNKNDALMALLNINKLDPNGKYAACPLLEPIRTRQDFYKGR